MDGRAASQPKDLSRVCMDIIHGVNETVQPRLAATTLQQRLVVMPAVVVTGAHQTGKSTLVRDLIPGPRRYFSLDDIDVLDLARRDPETLLEGDEPVILDEVQREPSLLVAVKRAIDRRRRLGHFLLTGSANLLLMHRVSESLAGRASYLSLWPMTRREQLGLGLGGVWEQLLDTPDAQWPDLLAAQSCEPEDWRALARRGGMPPTALHLETVEQRSIWFDGYERTYLERDLQELSSIAALPEFRRLMRAVCLRLGQTVNQTTLGRVLSLSQPTVHRYLNLLEISQLLVRVPAYSLNRTKRLIKAPKLYWADTGMALHLAQLDEPTGAHLENLILHDLLAWRDTRSERAEILHWRTAAGTEVDFVVETADRLLPIEVKSSLRPRLRDTAPIRSFRAEYGAKARCGLLLHSGDTIEWITPDVLSAPWWRVL